ncbi:MAG: hypothetical protein AB7Q97_22315 [Gammaproteobacteria bacterium]
MACCIIGALILYQVLETWRRFKAFLGLEGGARPGRLRALLARRGTRVAIASVLALEGIAAAAWVVNANAEQLHRVAGYFASSF